MNEPINLVERLENAFASADETINAILAGAPNVALNRAETTRDIIGEALKLVKGK